MAVMVADGRLTLTGYVGESTVEFDGVVYFDGFTHPEVVTALGEIGDDADLEVHINSGGGYAYEGAAIRSALAERGGRTDVVIEGVAASAASLIAMAGETIRIADDAVLMIHDPSGLTIGTAADHEAAVRALNTLGTAYARTYARRSGMSIEAAREVMRAETWYDAGAAVAAGFADEVLGQAGAPVAAFPFQIYAHAPRQLVAMAQAEGWRRPLPPLTPRKGVTAAAPPAPPSPKEPPMADPNPAGAPAPDAAALSAAVTAAVQADRARRATILALPEAAGRQAQAQVLADTTDLAPDAIKAILAAGAAAPDPQAAAPDPKAGGTTETDPAAYEASRLAGAGMGAPAPTAGQPRVSLVDNMKRRHGIKA